MKRTARLLALVATLAAGLAWVPMSSASASSGTPLVGTFTIAAGSCSGGVASGTYLRMVLSGGTNSGGPYFSNSDSSCSDNTYTPLAPGSAGGLVTGEYQPQPSPAFDSAGNALSDGITTPVAFEGVKFGTSTNPVDPQTGLKVSAPSITTTGTVLSGNLQAFGVQWNNQQFNQGSPKPDGTSPANTTPVTGTYNSSTGAYTLEWSSQVVGGPFNGFSAYWHLTGTFRPSGGTAAPSSGSTATTAPASSGSSAGVSTSPSASSGSTTPSTSGTGASAGTATSSTTSTTTPGQTAQAAGTTSNKIVLTSHTTSTGGGGWDVPIWAIALLALVAALGLAGVIWAEANRRKQGANA